MGYQQTPGMTGSISAGGEYDDLNTTNSNVYPNLAAEDAAAAAISAADALASKNAAATSATNAASSATTASTNATTATTQASNAATSATAAQAANTAAGVARTGAEAARDATYATYDNFDDRYLGEKTSNPTVNNDGDPLITGALYFNSTSSVMRVYTGTTWMDIASGGGGGGGSVTSVGLSAPTFLSVSNSPITSYGTIALSYSGTPLPVTNGGTGATTASGARSNLGLVIGTDVLAPNGSAASLTSFPTFNQNTTGNAANVTGIVAVANGGTNATSAADARTNLGLGTAAVLAAGSAFGAATLDAGGTIPLAQIPASIKGGVSYQGTWNATTNTPTLTSGSGTKGYYYVISVVGSTSLDGITDWKIGDWAIFNGTVWQKVDNTDAVTSVNGYTGTVALAYSDLGTVPVANGGTNITTYATGDILYASAANTLSKLTAGTNGNVLTLASGVPSWAAASGGGGTPGGSSGQLQYNNSSAFGGVTNITVASGQTTARIDPRVFIGGNTDTTLAPNISQYDMYVYTALANNLFIDVPTGTPLNGDKIMFRFADNGTSKILSWNGIYRLMNVPIPTSTGGSGKITYVGCIYNSFSSTWDVIASGTQI